MSEAGGLKTAALADAPLLEAVLRLAADAIMVADADGWVRRLNPAAEKLFAAEMERAASQPPHLRDLSAALDEWLELASAGRRAGSMSFRVSLGAEHDFAADLLWLPGAGGWLLALHDVTHLTRLEQWRAEVIQAAAHDVRSPLNLARGALDLLQDSLASPSDAQLEYLSMLRSGLARIGGLVNELLNLDTVEAGVDLSHALFSLREAAQVVARDFQVAAGEKGQQLEFEGVPAGVRVMGDEAWLQRALANLIDNAIKYTAPGGRIWVRYREAGRQAIVEVQDTGPGIPRAAQARLFQRFYRVRSEATRQAPGTGLGLALVKAIADKHGGRVWVESTDGEGSLFGLSLPLADEE